MTEHEHGAGAIRPDVFDPDCGSRRLLGLLADRWTALIVYALTAGTHRHAELQRTIGGVSQKMLTGTLRELERNGLVHREVLPVSPPHVQYSLTPLGESLRPVLAALCDWSQQHVRDLPATAERGRQAAAG